MTIYLGLPSVSVPASAEQTPNARSRRLAAVRDGMLGSVHSWELVTAVDGPGTRLTIFLAGCALRCRYCHNPDTWSIRHGRDTPLEEVLALIDRYQKIMRVTGGGVTLSGGEPLLQHAFVRRIFRRCAEQGIHTALDTSGFLGSWACDDLLSDTSLVLLDVKSGLPDVYRTVTRRELEPTLEFGRRLARLDLPMWIRFVLVPGLTDGWENVEAAAEYAASLQRLGSGGAVARVEVLGFHQLGRDKWHELGESYPLEDTQPPSAELLERVREQFRSRGLTVR
ncbi:pyruvate formate-lyase-activating enzyme [Microlunatus phosphovorus NM-1]|uniref:Pyruvate formate-lyase-activating enzyme n=1 Tax=Microlunatus phosphovorus (strain ATCC 700054 / DSM 10555 / JCM 9379 / NBRC 101784 / NCIMB 13414 / VKM Ac-1990 / NM-1) TaxID=1032480 RepID=F5XM99_MICPN|nr:pyruvate formate-lyase-activating protein [Microlunatus phosphovorus]BAK36356.1 pyruvate formate-lyase-activating enzyme [Microlunatus phosphovorus NM-1]